MVDSYFSILFSSSIGLEPDCSGLRLSIAEAATLLQDTHTYSKCHSEETIIKRGTIVKINKTAAIFCLPIQ